MSKVNTGTRWQRSIEGVRGRIRDRNNAGKLMYREIVCGKKIKMHYERTRRQRKRSPKNLKINIPEPLRKRGRPAQNYWHTLTAKVYLPK